MSFCSRAALAAHAPAAGTGVRAEAYVFLPVPKRLWRENELNDGWASPDEIATIRTARARNVVTRLYNPPRNAETGPILVYAASDPVRSETVEPLLAHFAGRWPVDATGKPRLAVCTHGTRDRCCAKFGFAVYGRARALYEAGTSPFEPIECSHLGGDRFAATGIVFPSGSMYAHLDATDLSALFAAESAGEIAPVHYRGRVFEGSLTQVVRAGLAREGLYNHATAPIVVAPAHDGDVRVSAGGAAYLVSLQVTETGFFPSCERMAAGRASKARQTVYAGARPLD